MNDTTLQQQQQHPDMLAPDAHGNHVSDETEQSTPENPTKRPACDGYTVDVLKRRRGRPRGSRNKAKTPVVVPSDVYCSMAALLPQILEVPSGYDFAELLGQLARARNQCVCVTSAVGAVADVVLRNLQIGGRLSQTQLCGKYDILSISGIFLPPKVPQTTSASVSVVSISLAGPQGQVVGGTATGRLVAAGTVVLIVTMVNRAIPRLGFDGSISMPHSKQNHVYNQQQDHQLHGQQEPILTPAISAEMSNYSDLVVPNGLLIPQPSPSAPLFSVQRSCHLP